MNHKTIRAALSVACSVAAMAAAAPAAMADFSITSATGAVSIDGGVSRQAGAHADLSTTIVFTPEEHVRDVRVDLPPGVTGNPLTAPTCSAVQFTAGQTNGPGNSSICPVNSQVGLAEVYDSGLGVTPDKFPIYNLERPADKPGLFGFNYLGVVVRIVPSVRAGDYGITAQASSISQAQRVRASTITLWGLPAAAVHDGDRFVGDSANNVLGAPNTAPLTPFLTNPTSCGDSPLTTSVFADSWEHPGAFSSVSFDSDADGTPFINDGCFRLGFHPLITVGSGSRHTDSPTSLDVNLSIPQSDDSHGLATAHLRKAVVTLPQGFTVSPSSAQGLGACSPSDIGLGSDADPTCPESSKIGTIKVDTPLLKDPVEGDVILAKQNDNPFKSLLAIYLVAKGPGVMLKLPGKIDADPETGRLVTTFDNQPQLPFSNLSVKFHGGPRAPLATPTTCGTYTTHVEMTSWASSIPVSLDTPMVIDQGCSPRGFSPTFNAGVVDPTAGTSSPFTLTFSRQDGEQYLSALNVVLPPGLLGNVGSLPRCGEAQAAAGTCGAESQIGTTSVLSGPGDTPLAIPAPGKAPTGVYLAGPYKGAPFSLSVVVPAQAGPFDLGSVVVRAGLYVDPNDTHVTVKSDPLPTILQGIPLRLRQVNVVVGRPGFMRNPTSCAPTSIAATIFSADGAAANVGSPFKVGGCADLSLTPKLSLGVAGKRQTKDGAHPALTATVTQPIGQANLKKVEVTMPLSLALDPDNAQSKDLCEFEDGQREEPACPANSIVGTAKAVSPVLDQPLTGPIYFVKNIRIDAKSGRRIRTLPQLIIPLKGEGVSLVLRATTNVVGGRLVTTFASIPDAPVTSFSLALNGGKKGILVVSDADICKSAQTADEVIYGQNNKLLQTTLPITTSSCPLQVLAKKTSKTAMTVRVGGLGSGTVTMTGAGIKKVSRKLLASSVATLSTSLTSKGRASLRQNKRLSSRVTIAFRPASGATHRVVTSMLCK
jgi:hypothetical protein